MTLFGLEFQRVSDRSAIEPARKTTLESLPKTLAQVKPGSRVQIQDFLEGLSHTRQAHLQSYGVIPGNWVTVIQHSPVTIIEVDHLELALERELAERISILAD